MATLPSLFGRRGFFSRLGIGVGAIAVSIFGTAKNAEAVGVACCNLCLSSSGGCDNAACTWYWECCDNQEIWYCHECYDIEFFCTFPICYSGMAGSKAVNTGIEC